MRDVDSSQSHRVFDFIADFAHRLLDRLLTDHQHHGILARCPWGLVPRNRRIRCFYYTVQTKFIGLEFTMISGEIVQTSGLRRFGRLAFLNPRRTIFHSGHLRNRLLCTLDTRSANLGFLHQCLRGFPCSGGGPSTISLSRSPESLTGRPNRLVRPRRREASSKSSISDF
jgi:hypothetical protein